VTELNLYNQTATLEVQLVYSKSELTCGRRTVLTPGLFADYAK